uniref:SGNH hydrolase-type esterase domain-containing protein n=1 Tax=Odontella aurita TaxID=265563 RepID=A0A7S4NID9_9STRA|mmetsp:Transcript_8983/g.26841  ORF Transcript_8983/g.26841 Transcript_8983/m.26841 type:complete len:591 (+) Transcript_8983:203-1975(+)
MIGFIFSGGSVTILLDAAAPLVSWVHVHAKLIIVAVILAVPAVALIQGACFLLWYRFQYGADAPVPLLPAHGVTVVNPVDIVVPETDDSDSVATEASSLCSPFFSHDVGSSHMDSFESSLKKLSNGKFSSTGATSVALGSTRETGSLSDLKKLRRAANTAPLRLLMVGDSLAAGVGVSKSATPVLPEVIAKSLSKGLGGRAVFWTCIAEPGASSGWIVRELENVQSDEGTKKVDFITSSSQRALASLLEEEEVKPIESIVYHNEMEKLSSIDDSSEKAELDEWRNRLSLHGELLKSDKFGEYDIACVMTGVNDLKGAVMPWLLQGDEVKLRQQARQRGGNYTSELKRVVDTVANKMKAGLSESLDRVQSSVDNIRERIGGSSHASLHLSSPETLPLMGNAKESDVAEINRTFSDESFTHPLIVLPALPSNLPVLQIFPFIYFLLPLIHIADRFKRKLAETYPHAILYVEHSSINEMLDFENRRGFYYNQMVREDTLLALNDQSPEFCARVKEQMKNYCSKKGNRQIRYLRRGRHKPKAVVQPANVRIMAPGASLLSLDGIHPNDAGYEFWGRHIAAAILSEWKLSRVQRA